MNFDRKSVTLYLQETEYLHDNIESYIETQDMLAENRAVSRCLWFCYYYSSAQLWLPMGRKSDILLQLQIASYYFCFSFFVFFFSFGRSLSLHYQSSNKQWPRNNGFISCTVGGVLTVSDPHLEVRSPVDDAWWYLHGLSLNLQRH